MKLPLRIPTHPRTRANAPGLCQERLGGQVVKPLGYLDFPRLMAWARVVIAASGGIKEETKALGVECITVWPNAECSVTLTMATNPLVAPQASATMSAVQETPSRTVSGADL